jgi:molybdenum cofactor biosynthesis protein B
MNQLPNQLLWKKVNFFTMKQSHIKSIPIHAAIITISSSRTKDDDTSGKTINTILNSAGITVEYYAIAVDKTDAIRAEIYNALKTCNCIIVNGGTGLTYDDVTIEAVLPLLDKKIDGFGELFRTLSYNEIGTSSMLSRALAGVSHGSVIFCIPGSTAAVTLATKNLILPEIAHILSHANK